MVEVVVAASPVLSSPRTLLEAGPSRLDLSEWKWKCRTMISVGSTLDASLKLDAIHAAWARDNTRRPKTIFFEPGASRTRNVLPSADSPED